MPDEAAAQAPRPTSYLSSFLRRTVKEMNVDHCKDVGAYLILQSNVAEAISTKAGMRFLQKFATLTPTELLTLADWANVPMLKDDEPF